MADPASDFGSETKIVVFEHDTDVGSIGCGVEFGVWGIFCAEKGSRLPALGCHHFEAEARRVVGPCRIVWVVGKLNAPVAYVSIWSQISGVNSCYFFPSESPILVVEELARNLGLGVSYREKDAILNLKKSVKAGRTAR